jgi:amino acid transporter
MRQPGSSEGGEGAPPPHGRSLRRVVTLPWLVLYGVGSTVGAGIYVLTGAVAGRAGMQAPFAFLLAAVLALFTALSFAELSARFPRAGGALVYVREGLGLGWLSVAVGLGTSVAGMVSAATVCLGFVGYLGELWTLPPKLVLLAVVALLGLIAAWGVRESVVAAGLMTLLEVSGLLAILVFGAGHLADLPARAFEMLPVDLDSSGWIAMGGSVVLCFYAFLGFEDMVNVAEEVQDVRRVLPRGILWTLGLSTALYTGVTIVAVLAVSPEELAGADAPLALVFERSGGSAELLGLIAMAAMVNGALIQIVMASRILFSLSREGPLPGWVGWVHPRTRTPLVATIGISSAIALLALSFPLAGLAAATATIALAIFSLVNLALLALLRRERARGVAASRTPIWVPAVGAVVSVVFLALELVGRLTNNIGAP